MSDSHHQLRFHASTAIERASVLASLRDAGDDRCMRMAERIKGCGSDATLYQDDDGFLSVGTARCKSRMCPTCSKKRSGRTFVRIRELVELLDVTRMLTLTTKSNDTPLKDQVRHLNESWNKLRRRKQFKAKFREGIKVIEVTFNHQLRQWHPHLHVIFDGQYAKQSEIKAAWLEITGDSDIVHISMMHSRDKAVNYLAKYVSKTSTMPTAEPKYVREWVDAVASLREFSAFGKLHGAIKPYVKQASNSESICPMNALAHDAAQGDREAKRIYNSILSLPRRSAAEDCPPELLARHSSLARAASVWWLERMGLNFAPPPTRCVDSQLPLIDVKVTSPSALVSA